jgi:hypothetical protein
MATYVNDLRLTELATGEGSGSWGTTTNLSLELIGEALGYATQQSFGSDADATTTVADGASDPARAMYFKITSAGSLTATRTLTIAPNTISRVMFIENATTGSQSIAISQGSGASVTILTGKTAVVYLDGAGAAAAVVDAMASVDPGVTDTLAEVLAAGNTSGGTNIELSTTDKVQFRDAAIYINSSVDGQLDIVADTEIQIAATTVDLNGNLDVSGTTVSAGKITADAGIDIDNINIDGTTIALSSGDLTLDVAGDIVLDAGGSEIRLSKAGTEFGKFATDIGTPSQFAISSSVLDGDIKLQGNDGGSTITALTLDMSEAGAATFNSSVTATSLDISGDIDVDGTTNLDVVDIDGAVDMASTLTVAGTLSSAGGLVHQGDANTSLDFGTDQQTFYVGGVRALDLSTTGAVFNEGSADADFRVESSGNANMLFVDGGNDRIGIGTATPSSHLEIAGTAATVVVNAASSNSGVGLYSGSTNTDQRNWDIRANSTAFGDFVIRRGTSQGATPSTTAFSFDKDGAATFSAGITATTGTFSGAITLGSGIANNTINLNNSTADMYLGISGGSLFGYASGAISAIFNTSAVPMGIGPAGAQDLILGTYSTARVTIDGTTGAATFSGNVGVNGATSPNSSLAILSDSGANAVEIRTRAAGDDYAFINFNSTDASEALGAIGVHRTAAATASLIFYSNDGTAGVNEVGRFDDSGNLLVGKSATAFGTAGIEASASNGLWSTRSGLPALALNRLSTDGSIADFYKDGTVVGSTGANNGTIYFAGPNANTGGFRIDSSGSDGVIIPTTNTGANRDAAVDLGYSSGGTNIRFKDLYLSGGVYLGGTGADNLLNDYEEGTWTPVLSKSTTAPSVTYTAQLGAYTKVGRLVFVSGRLAWSAISGGTGEFRIADLPFTILNSTSAYSQMTSIDYGGVTFGANDTTFGGYGAINGTYIVLIASKNNATDSTAISGLETSGFMYFNLTYQAA